MDYLSGTFTIMPTDKYILYADDDRDDREMMEDVFIPLKEYRLVTFETGEALLAFVKRMQNKIPICLIVLDINMPTLNGMQVLRELKSSEDHKHLPVVMFSTSNSPLDKQTANYFKTDVVTKPMNLEQVRQMSQQLLSYCGHQQQH
ncbi:MAG: response regulator [Flaviaesturariibacter sp.]|nr:response regulator [Flaviaesturariibacter sp.]